MEIRLATKDDIPQLMPLFEAASRGLRQMRVNQWQNGYPQPELIANDIANGVSYLLEPTYNYIEGKWLTDEEAFVVIHRQTIRPDRRGQRLSDLFFGYAEQLCRERGVRSMRIDTHEGNLPMQRAVERYGFVRCGVIYLDNGDPRLAYEKPL